MLAAPPDATVGAVLGRHGGDRKSEKAKDQVDIVKSIAPPSGKGGNSAEYLTARLERDYPEIAAEVRAKTISPRAGALRAGIIRELSPLEKAQAANLFRLGLPFEFTCYLVHPE